MRVAIIGAGLIGESWAALITAYGHDVSLWDPAIRSDAASRIARAREDVLELDKPASAIGALHVADSVADAVSEAALIQENAPENLQLKHNLYRQIEEAAAPDAIIASSTSSFTWSQLAPALERPQRLITAHPFNPPHLMPLVEIFASDAHVRDAAIAFYAGLGRAPAALNKDAPGHIANRLSSALWREAVHIVAEGIADVAAVDSAMMHGPGLRWCLIGPHMAYHLGGGAGGMASYLEHLGSSQERRWTDLGAPALTPEVRAMLVRGVAEEADGRSVEDIAAARDQALKRVRAALRGTS